LEIQMRGKGMMKAFEYKQFQSDGSAHWRVTDKRMTRGVGEQNQKPPNTERNLSWGQRDLVAISWLDREDATATLKAQFVVDL